MKSLTLNDINNFLLYKQHLTELTRTQNLIELVKDIAGLHATIPMTPYLSLFARSDGFTKELLDEELYVKKHLGKIRSIRKTLYIFPQELIPVFHVATKRINEKQSKKALEHRGISLGTYQTISDSILEILRDKKEDMTALEIKKALHTKLNISYILYLMCDQKLIIRSRPRKYFLFKEYFPDLDIASLDEPKAYTQLIQYYLGAFGPVSEQDIIWWTGLGKTIIQSALTRIQDEVAEVEILDLDKNLLLLQSDIDLIEKTSSDLRENIVNLLPALDSYIMGYKERDRYFLSNNHSSFVFDRTGNATSIILSDGRIIGVWDVIKDDKPKVKFFLFKEPKDIIRDLIRQKAKKIGKFIYNTDVLITECDSMIPLNERTAGSFMSPLKEN
ncbi:MAG: winged helix DNA-binding domain-containing protein [Promethearchaeota archaeon]